MRDGRVPAARAVAAVRVIGPVGPVGPVGVADFSRTVGVVRGNDATRVG
ncbi:hypothetical protein [Streptomyces sp. NPDC096934]